MSTQNNGISFQLGRFVGRWPRAFLGLLFAALVVIYGLFWLNRLQAEAEQLKAEQQAVAAAEVHRLAEEVREKKAAEELAQKCGANFSALATKAADLVKSGNANDAFNLIKPCNLYADATAPVKKFIQDTSAAASLERAEKMTREDARRADTAKKVDEADKAARRKQGVQIGMSKEQVLASNWGKPTKINRTTGANYEHEQWVYDGGYLYFRGGVLSTIQN
jgi:hypothetical protein